MSRWNKLYVQRLKFGPYEIAALIIIALAVLLRIFLIAKGWPETNSDEGTMGLEATLQLHLEREENSLEFSWESCPDPGPLRTFLAPM